MDGLIDLADEPYALRRLNMGGPLAYYAAESVGAHRAARNTFQMLAFVALGAMLLGGLASLWLARALATPIDQLSQRLRQIADSRDFSQKIQRTGTSLELDAFTDTFNQMVTSLQAAEAQTELAYVGAIKALAAALDARDTYTAGHSERVSALSVMIGRQLGLTPAQLDVLRLGALLHDIGKIGVADRVLQKNGPLTQEEFEIIKAHPALGAHILRQISFLTPHIPIVELHHERPDGRGYPQGPAGPCHAPAGAHRPRRRRVRRHDHRPGLSAGPDAHTRHRRALAVCRVAVRRRSRRGVRHRLVRRCRWPKSGPTSRRCSKRPTSWCSNATSRAARRTSKRPGRPRSRGPSGGHA